MACVPNAGLPQRIDGDFVYTYLYGRVQINTVPAYQNYYGTAPTSLAMLAGFYDGQAAFQSLIPGDAATQTAQVNAR